jgi:opacity protein-like surface antigen
MQRYVTSVLTFGVVTALSVGLAVTAAGQGARSTRHIRVHKNASTASTSQASGSISSDTAAGRTNTDALARARQDSIDAANRAHQDSVATGGRGQQDSIATAERTRQDSIAQVAQRARADSTARIEAMRRDSMARADSIARGDSLARAMRNHLPGLYVNLGGGANFPLSDLKNGYKTGWNGTASLGWHPVDWPVGVRIDGAYDRLMGKTLATVGTVPNVAVWSALGNLTLKVPNLMGVSPYLIGGAGLYHLSGYNTTTTTTYGTTSSSSSANKFGWNAGGGISFNWGTAGLFVESRYTRISTEGTAAKYVPLIAGVTIRP